MNAKRLLILLVSAAVFFIGCKKDENVSNEKKYEFVDNTTISSEAVEYKVRLHEYDNNGSCIAINQLEFPEIGKNYGFTANKRSEKVKVYLYWKIVSSAEKWVKTVFYLEDNETIKIELDNHTVISNDEPD